MIRPTFFPCRIKSLWTLLYFSGLMIGSFLKMVSMILDGCKDLDEAKEKVAELIEDNKKEKAE